MKKAWAVHLAQQQQEQQSSDAEAEEEQDSEAKAADAAEVYFACIHLFQICFLDSAQCRMYDSALDR